MDQTKNSLKHERVRGKQKLNDASVHHPAEKIEQIQKVLGFQTGLHILELFSGEGNLTPVYANKGANYVECYDKKKGTGDSFIQFHYLIGRGEKYDVVDLDPYGFPSRFFPDIFLLFHTEGYLFVTFPRPGVQNLNGITQTHLESYWGLPKPGLADIISKIRTYGLCHWFDVELKSAREFDNMWRFAFHVKRVKATEYCNVRNQMPKEQKENPNCPHCNADLRNLSFDQYKSHIEDHEEYTMLDEFGLSAK